MALKAGQEIVFENIKLMLNAWGIKAVDVEGKPLASHEAFWFAWSQFYPATAVWSG